MVTNDYGYMFIRYYNSNSGILNKSIMLDVFICLVFIFGLIVAVNDYGNN